MLRFLTSTVLCLLVAATVQALPLINAPKQGPSSEQIQHAVEELASPRFAVREKASKLLWEAGATAEPALREAAKAKDEETANRAKQILEKFDWGMYPDTPKPILALIEKFKGGDAALRQESISALTKLRPVPLSIMQKLIARETEPEARAGLYNEMTFEGTRIVPELIVANRLVEARDFLEACLYQGMGEAFRNYAAFQYLRGKLPEAQARMQARQSDEALAYLHRVRKDFPAARLHAEKIKDELLQEAIAWEANDWKTLANRPPRGGDLEDRGSQAAYHRLAGEQDKYAAMIEEMKKEVTGVEGDDGTAYLLSAALLLNGQGAEAVKLLADRPKFNPGFAFDLLCAQFKYKEAFDLADKAAKELPIDEDGVEEKQTLDLHRAKVLASLGDRDAATQIFRRVFDYALEKQDSDLILQVLEGTNRGHLRDLLIECTLRFIAMSEKQMRFANNSMALVPLFGRAHGAAAHDWWRIYRRSLPQEKPEATMKRVLDILDGKADGKTIDELSGFAMKLLAAKDQSISDVTPIAFALGEAYRMSGVPDKAEEQYNRAIAAEKTIGNLKPIDPNGDAFIDDIAMPLHSSNVRRVYGDLLMTQKRYADAAKQYQDAWKIEPDEPLLLFLQGQALIQAGDKVAGARLCELSHWVPLGDNHVRATFSRDLSEHGYDADSLREMELVLAVGWLDSFYVGYVHARAGRIKARDKNYADAAVAYEKNLIQLFRSGGRPSESKAFLAMPEQVRAFRAQALIGSGKIDAAMAEARIGLATLPGNVDLAIALVPQLTAAGKTKEADEIYAHVKKTFDAALADFRLSPDLSNGIAWTMVNCNRDLDVARKHAETAVERAPRTAAYLDTLAEIHFRQKDRAKALELMKQCRKLEPGVPYYRKQLERFEKLPFESPLPDEETGDS